MKIASLLLSAGLGISLFLAARPAHAGYCDEESAESVIARLEVYAKKKGKEVPVLDGICMETVETMPKVVKRTIAACTKVIAREPAFSDCVMWSVKFGAKQLGDVDLFGKIGELFKLDPYVAVSSTVDLYVALDDARAVPLLIEGWKAMLLDKRYKQQRYNYNTTKWRHAAIKVLAKHGGPSERAFLDEQLKDTKDKGVKKALTKAIAQIDQRAAAPK